MDQGIIQTFKAYYIRQSFQTIFDRLENDENKTLIQIWKEFSILDCVKTISSAYKELKSSTLNACWKALLPGMVQSENAVPPADVEYTRIVNVASRLGGEGFTDMNIRDVEELFLEQTLNEEELMEFIHVSSSNASTDDNFENMNDGLVANLNLNDVQKGIDLAKQLEFYFIEKDPSVVRSGKFKRELQSCLAPYREVLAQLQSKNTLVSATNSARFEDEDIQSDEDFRHIKRKKVRPLVISDDSDE